jgi:hypothetical protein
VHPTVIGEITLDVGMNIDELDKIPIPVRKT